MIEKLLEKLQNLVRTRSAFDPSQLGDPLALQTNWTPAKGGGSSFRTHKLIEVNPNRLEFRASVGALLFYLIFLLVGVGVSFGITYSKLSSGRFSWNMETIMPLLLGLVFASIGGGMFFFGTTPIVFDKREGYFWKGRKDPAELFDKTSLKNLAKLDEIHALQLIAEYCRGNKSSFYSYELNLVLQDGQRINVVDHGNPAKLQEDAATLSAFLKKPIWDAIG
jgi:hypothetical protein